MSELKVDWLIHESMLDGDREDDADRLSDAECGTDDAEREAELERWRSLAQAIRVVFG